MLAHCGSTVELDVSKVLIYLLVVLLHDAWTVVRTTPAFLLVLGPQSRAGHLTAQINAGRSSYETSLIINIRFSK